MLYCTKLGYRLHVLQAPIPKFLGRDQFDPRSMGMGTGPGKGLPPAYQGLRGSGMSVTTLERPIANVEQLKSVHSRHRSYVVHECRQNIMRLYKLDYQTKDEVVMKVKWLLEKDRFVCREEQRELGNPRQAANRR